MQSNAHAGRARVARPLGLFLSALLVSCGKCNREPVPPPVSTLHVLPATVRILVPAGASEVSYRLEGVALNNYENPVGGTLTWSASPAGVTLATESNAVVVTVPASLPLESVVTVTATLGILSASSTAVIAEPKTTDDVVTDDEAASENPSVVLASGDDASVCAVDAIRAFVVSAPVGPFDASTACGRAEALVFSTTGKPHIVRPQLWTPTSDVVDATTPAGPIEIPLQIVIGVKSNLASAADSYLDNALLIAAEALRNMRVGVSLPPGQQTKIRQELSASVDNCDDIATLPTTVTPKDDRLNFYVVEWIVNNARGVYCQPNVMLISRTAAVASTPLHELGHALGLLAQDVGHVDNVEGFMRDNVMSTTTGTGSGADLRYRLTLGQLYRMHRDGRSWLLRDAPAPENTFRCPCDPYASNACPMLSADMRPPAGNGLKPFPPGLCT